MHRFTLLFFLMILLTTITEAQEHRHVCGNTYADQMSQMKRYLNNMRIAKSRPSRSRNAVTYIPIQFNVITKNDGSGGVQITDLMDQMCLLNEQFGEFDVRFFFAEDPKYIANEVIYENHTVTSAQFTMRQRRNREALNVWMVNDASSSSGPPVGITLGYYDTVNDWVVIRRNQISGQNNTLAHEVGHFFSLMHPHLGWDADPYSTTKHGSPVSDRAPNGSRTELMDGSNCETAGDMLCDTRPDYNFALTWNNRNSCDYSADVKDPNGDQVDPDETLIMSYFSDNCTSRFTQSQVDLMLADIATPGRNFLTTNDYSPSSDEITDSPKLVSPINREVTSSFNKVKLDWDRVAGATSYLVEVDRSSSFNIDNFKYITSSSSIVLEDVLEADRNYRWRVTPFNPSNTCSPPSETARFITGLSTSVSTIETVNEWTIQPNPTTANQTVTIKVTASETFDATLQLFSTTGQLVKQVPQQFDKGTTTLNLETSDLSKGIYLVSLR
ncbi:MAG: zinc-dependent metalloprotease, partial [Bacteroidota bacterium]